MQNNRVILSISPNQLEKHLTHNKNFNYIDVRGIKEFESEHINQFINIPLDQLNKRINAISKENPIIITCESGNRSKKACEILIKKGMAAQSLEGGITEWKHENKQTIIGPKKTISIMRQVQIIVGTAVLLGSLFAYFININFIWLSAFFGTGLLFAGLSNTCTLATLLTKMPWNK